MTLHLVLVLVLSQIVSTNMVFANLPTLGERPNLLVQRVYSKDEKTPSVGAKARVGHSLRREKGEMAAGGVLIGEHDAGGKLSTSSSSSSSHSSSPAKWCLPPSCRHVIRPIGEEADHSHNAEGTLGPKPNGWTAGKKGGSSSAEANKRGQAGTAASGGEMKKRKPPVNLVVQTIRKDNGEKQRMAATARGPPLEDKEGKKKEERDVKEKEEIEKREKEKVEREKQVKEKEERAKRDNLVVQTIRKVHGERQRMATAARGHTF